MDGRGRHHALLPGGERPQAQRALHDEQIRPGARLEPAHGDLPRRDQRLCHEDVDTAATVQPDSLVSDMQWVPEAKRDAVRFQLVHQALLIGGFQKTRSEFPVNLDRTGPKNIT